MLSEYVICTILYLNNTLVPELLIMDGLQSYHAAFNKEYCGNGRRHLNTIKLTGNHNNNCMERVNGDIRDREKTMRGLKK